MTERFKKMTKAYNELRKKFTQFEAHDLSKFQDIWEMNENEVKQLGKKVLDCDRIVYE